MNPQDKEQFAVRRSWELSRRFRLATSDSNAEQWVVS